MLRIKLELLETSQPLKLLADNTYTKGGLYCVYAMDKVIKFPMCNIFRITEDYDNSYGEPEPEADQALDCCTHGTYPTAPDSNKSTCPECRND